MAFMNPFLDRGHAPVGYLLPQQCQLHIRQQPKEAVLTVTGKEKTRKPIDPPPIIELQVDQHVDPYRSFLQNPYLFLAVTLWKADKDEPSDRDVGSALTGTLTSSLHRLKDTHNKEGAFFVFGDISIKIQGTHRLHFSLFEFQNGQVQWLANTVSQRFKVVLPKDFKGMESSTQLSRTVADQGVRLRLRKEPRVVAGQKRGYDSQTTPAPIRPSSDQSSPHDQQSMPKRIRTDSFPEPPNPPISAYSNQPIYHSTGYPVGNYNFGGSFSVGPGVLSNPAFQVYPNTMTGPPSHASLSTPDFPYLGPW